jgi:N-acetylglucosaminyl-diphospho-decaprenol L-rhamnosyltransferase
MRVCAVVVAHNSARDLPASLGSLGRLPLLGALVVDNASTDDSVEIAKRFTPHVITSANVGFGAAVNVAVADAAERFPNVDALLLLNPDCELAAKDFALLGKALDADPALGVVAPLMRYPGGRYGISAGPEPSMAKEWLAALRVDHLVPRRVKGRLAHSAALRARLPMLGYLAVKPDGGIRPAAWVSGFCMLVRATAFHEVGGFDRDYFLYFEDVDLCKRVRGHGWGVASVGASVAQHKESTSTSVVGKKALYRSGMLVYFSKHGSRSQRLAARALRGLPI